MLLQLGEVGLRWGVGPAEAGGRIAGVVECEERWIGGTEGRRGAMVMTKRPRVAAIGLDGEQAASIALLCGAFRAADSLEGYLERYSWTETDIVVLGTGTFREVATGVNLIAVGDFDLEWSDFKSRPVHYYGFSVGNTERELRVSSTCPDIYRPMATELCWHLGRSGEPSPIVITSRDSATALIQTTSGLPSLCVYPFLLDRMLWMVSRHLLHSCSLNPPTWLRGSGLSCSSSMSPTLLGYPRHHPV